MEMGTLGTDNFATLGSYEGVTSWSKRVQQSNEGIWEPVQYPIKRQAIGGAFTLF